MTTPIVAKTSTDWHTTTDYTQCAHTRTCHVVNRFSQRTPDTLNSTNKTKELNTYTKGYLLILLKLQEIENTQNGRLLFAVVVE
jgi:hypothetical protein